MLVVVLKSFFVSRGSNETQQKAEAEESHFHTSKSSFFQRSQTLLLLVTSASLLVTMFAIRSVLVTTSKALVTRSDALVPSVALVTSPFASGHSVPNPWRAVFCSSRGLRFCPFHNHV